MKKAFLYFMILLFVGGGIVHLVMPGSYLMMMPPWFPRQMLWVYISGFSEIALGLLLIPEKTRRFSAQLIILMLIVFLLVIHIPQSIDFYKTGNENFVFSLIRIPVQFVLIGWAWVYTKK